MVYIVAITATSTVAAATAARRVGEVRCSESSGTAMATEPMARPGRSRKPIHRKATDKDGILKYNAVRLIE